MKEYLVRLFSHMAWADERILSAVEAATNPSALAHRELGHIIGVEHVWLARLEGRVPALAVWPTLTLDECRAWARRTQTGFQSFLDRQSDASLDDGVHYRNSAGAEFDSRISDILLHVALHGMYHRGKVNAALRGAGAEPAPADYIAFVRGVPAARS